MWNLMRVRRGLAAVVAVALMGWLAGGVRGAGTEPGGVPVVSRAIDEATLARAVANGEAMMGKAKWKVEVPNGGIGITAAGETVFCQLDYRGNHGVTALDAKTGRKRWDAGTTSSGGMGGMAARGRAEVADTRPLGGIPLQSQWRVLQSLQEMAGEAGLEFVEGGPIVRLCRLEEATGTRTVVWETPFGAGRAASSPAETRSGPLPPPSQSPVATIAETHVVMGGRFVISGEGGPIGTRVGPLEVAAFDRKTGKQQWTAPVVGGAAETSNPVVVDGRVYVMVDQTGYFRGGNSGKSFLQALDLADGRLLWSSPVEQTTLCAPAVKGPVVVTATQKGAVIAYDAQTGKEKWRSVISLDCDPAHETLMSMNLDGVRIWMDEERVIVPAVNWVYRNGMGSYALNAMGLAVFDVKSGKQVGYFNGTKENKAEGVWRTEMSSSSVVPQVYKGMIVVNGEMGIDLETLRMEWRIEASRVVMEGDTLYVQEAASGESGKAVIRAVPLEAWEEVKGR